VVVRTTPDIVVVPLASLNFLWLGRSTWNTDWFYNGRYDKIALYNGNLLALPDATVFSTLLTLVTGTQPNIINSSTSYTFRPAVNNFIGIVVDILNFTTSNKINPVTVTPSFIRLDVGQTYIDGTYLNITGSYIEVPSAPINVTAVLGANNDTVIINWSAPANNGGTDISSYTVTSSPIGGIATIDSVARTATVSGLTGGTAYTFTVKAINAAGSSVASQSTTPVTPIASITIPNKPTGVIVYSVGNGEATINWTAPSDGGSAIISYTVTSSPGGLIATTSTTSATVTGLTNGTSYTFTVIATNNVGPSTASNATNPPIIPIGPPSAPTIQTATAGNTEATVNWTIPASNGSTITGYIIERSLNLSNWFTDSSANNLATSKIVTNLSNGTLYYFRVYATSSAGNSTASVASNAVTPIGPPSTPTSVTTTTGNGEVTINWTAPSNGGSPITSYTVTSSSGLTITTENGTTTTATVQGLSNGTSYTFTVRATNVAGPSAASNPTTAVTPSSSSSTTPVTSPSSSNLIFNFYLPGSFGIAQDTELYIMDELSLGSREFHWRINCGNTLNELFLNRTYKQLSTNEEAIETNLSINNIYVNGLFNNVLNSTGGLNGNFIGLSTSTTSFSQRLLEMAALKIFAHAKARAAIGNDSDFVDLQTRVITHLYDSFSSANIRQQFFESYIKSQETINANGANDVDEYQNFNLANSQIFIYGIFSGNILDANPITVGTLTTNTYIANMRIELTGF